MKKLHICFIIIIFIFPFFAFFIQNSLASDLETITYEFQNDLLYERSDIQFNNSYNIREQQQFNGHYPATYSFENQSVGTSGTNIDFIDGETSTDTGYSISILAEEDNHKKVLKMITNGNNGKVTYWNNNFDDISYGTIEFWMKYIDNGQGSHDFRIYGTGWIQIIVIRFNAFTNKIQLYHGAGSGGTEITGLADTWYHFKIEFNCETDKQTIWVNGVTIILNVDFFNANNVDDALISRLYLFTGGGVNSLEYYIDAIGYSWNTTIDGKYFSFNDKIINNDFNTNDYTNFTVNKESVNCDSTIKYKTPILDFQYLELNNTDSVKGLQVKYTFYEQVNGYSIFHFKTNDTYKVYSGFSYGKDSNTVISLGIFNNGFYYYDGGWNRVDDLNNNTWYKVMINWYSSNETYDLFLDDIKDGNYDYMVSKSSINYFLIDLANTYKVSLGVDTIQVNDYSTLGYHIGDNILPTKEYTGYYETDKTEFRFKNPNELYPINYDGDIHDWHTYSTIDGYSRIDNDQDSIICHCIDDFDYQGIQNFNFNTHAIFINISIHLLCTVFNDTHPDSYIMFLFTGFSTQPFLKIWINSTSINYCIGDTTTKYYITDFNLNHDYKFNFFTNFELNMTNLDIFDNNVLEGNYNIPIGNYISKENYGLTRIYIQGKTRIDTKHIIYKIYSVGVYCNELSLASDYSYLEYNTKISKEFNIEHHNLITLISNGYYSLGLTSGLYIIENDYQLCFNTSEFHNYLEIKNCYDYYTNVINNGSLVFYLFENANFSFSYIQIKGCKLIQDSNEYWLEYSYNGVNIDNSYFYVDSLHNLKWFCYFDDTNTEYIKATFDINDISTTNYTFGFSSYIDNAYGYIYANYTTVNQEFQIYSYYNTRYYILADNYSLSKINILITDNNDDDIEGFSEGYIRDITLFPAYSVSYDLILTNILFMFIPLIIIFVPSLLIGIKHKSIIIPMFLFMAIICFIASLIPLWLLFIIILGGIVYFVNNRETDELL